jgi:phosphocarrier protein
MLNQTFVIKEPTGIDLKLAGELCETAVEYKSEAILNCGKTSANVKSLLSLLGACIKCKDEVELVCSGEDEREAFTTLLSLLGQNQELADAGKPPV